jgi:nardilysin
VAKNDVIKMEHIIRLKATPQHPSSTSRFGNLRDDRSDNDLLEKVREFYRDHYVANKMYLCLETTQSLDKMQKLAIKYFTDILPREAGPLMYPRFDYKTAFKPEFHEKMVYVKLKSDLPIVALTWCLYPGLAEYRCKPKMYVGYLLASEVSGSLNTYLRKNYLASDVDIGFRDSTYSCNSIFSLFTIYVCLTDKGLENIEEILDAIFSFLKFLEKFGSAKSYHSDWQKNYCATLYHGCHFGRNSIRMRLHAPKDVVLGPMLIEYNREQITSVIRALNQLNFNLMILSDKHDFDKTEQPHKIEYSEKGESQEYLLK